MKINHIITAFAALLVMVSCDHVQPAAEEEQPASTDTSGLVTLSREQLRYAGIEYGIIEKQRLSNDVSARGELILPVNAKADLVSLYTGFIRTVKAHQGEEVKKGQVLAIIYSPEFIEAQQQYLMVKNQLAMLEQEYERQKDLNKEKIASDKYFQKALSDYNVAMAELSGLALMLKMAGIDIGRLDEGHISPEMEIIAPISGKLEYIDVNPGKYIMPEERLMQVINNEELLIELSVFEKDIMLVRPGQRVTFTLSNLGNRIYEAEVVAVGSTVRQDTRVVKVLASFREGKPGLLPGMFVASEIHTGEDQVDALPEEAVLRTGDDEFVIFYTLPAWLKDEGTSYAFVSVKTGNVEDGFVAVSLEEQIPADAMIVVKGGYYLKTELAKQQE